MTPTHPVRPWGELHWALGLSSPNKWHFLGCIGTEQRSVGALVSLHENSLLETAKLIRVKDTVPSDSDKEHTLIDQRRQYCREQGVQFDFHEAMLEAPINRNSWPDGMDFSGKKNLFIDISALPKRFFFSAVRSALLCPDVKNLVVLYSLPKSYPSSPQKLSGNPNPWTAMDNFAPLDPDIQGDIDSNLIISAGFVVGGLVQQLKNLSSAPTVNLVIPFPASSWSSISRSWESARLLEESLQLPKTPPTIKSSVMYHRVGALDCSAMFDLLMSLTKEEAIPASLAPLGPKPTSLAMCLLSAQTDFRHPVYYAQPKTYAINYSEGYESTYAYWIKHDGDNLYALPN